MINDPLYKRFQELSWRRKLTLEEEAEFRAWLQAHPEANQEWELEAGLSDALESLPEATVSNNFTARVLQDIQREPKAESGRSSRAWWRRFMPQAAVATVVLLAAGISFEQHQAAKLRKQERQALVVQSFVTVSKADFPEPKILEDFETIRLGAGVVADEKLLTLLQ